jgi:o-succinylbenzoate synthase
VKIHSFHFYNFSIPLARTLTFNDVALSSREGIIVHVISDKGEMGFGEAAPLPGISPESLRKVTHQLKVFKNDLVGREIPVAPSLLMNWLTTKLPKEAISSSARFGIESAILSMVASAKHKSMAAFFHGKPFKAVLTAGALQGSQMEVLGQAGALKVQNYEVFDVAVGNRNIPLEVQKVERLKDILGHRVRLRLNAGRSWKLDEAVLFARSIGKNQIEFIEEPCQDLGQWENFFRQSDVPFAVGTSFSEDVCERFEGAQGLGALVFRPTISGGVTGFWKALHHARERGCRLIVGSAVESGVGLTVLANLSVLTGEPPGLGSFCWLGEDLLAHPLVQGAGMVFVKDLTIRSDMFHDDFKRQIQII